MTPQEELQRIERLQRELYENRDAVARVARLEERTQFIPKEEVKQGYQPDKATMGYRVMVESFQATDQQLTPTQDARLSRVTSVIDGLNSDAQRFLMPWSRDPASRTQASLAAFTQEKMAQLNSVGETYISAGHDRHFNVVRIKRYQDGTLTYTLYDSGHETRGVGVRVDENGERRTQVNAVEERVIRPGASIEALIQAEARKSIVNAMPENGDTRSYLEQKAIIASLTEPTPIRVEVQDGQRRGNCTTRGQRIMMQDILADDALAARVHGFIVENTPQSVYQALSQERENVRAGRVRMPVPELHASESWKPYNSSAFGASLRFETGYDARVNDVTPQMRSFTDYMGTRGVDVKWGYRDGKAYAYVPQTDQASFNYLEQHLRAAQQAANADAERTVLIPETTRLALNNQTFEQVLTERLNTPGAVDYLDTNKGPSPIFRGDERTLNFLEQEFSRHGIEFVRETGNTPEFGHGIRVRSQSVEHINQLLRLAPERAAQQRFESSLSDKLANGSIERISSNKGESIVIRGDAQELRFLNEEFSRRGIDVVMESGDNGFGRGLRVRSTGMAQADAVLSRISRLAGSPESDLRASANVDAPERRSDDSVGSRLRGAAEAGTPDGGVKPAADYNPLQDPWAIARSNLLPQMSPDQRAVAEQLMAQRRELQQQMPEALGDEAYRNAPDAEARQSILQQRMAYGESVDGIIDTAWNDQKLPTPESSHLKPRTPAEKALANRMAAVRATAGLSAGNDSVSARSMPPMVSDGPSASLAVPAPEITTADLRVGQGTVEQLHPTSQARPAAADVPTFSPTAVLAANTNEVGANGRTAVADAGGRNSAARFMPGATAVPQAANDGARVASPSSAPAAPLAPVAPAAPTTSVPAPAAPTTTEFVSNAAEPSSALPDSAAVSAAAMAAAAAAGSDGVRPVSEPHRTSGANRAMGGAGFAMSTQMIQAIQEKLARGEEVSTAEYIAAGVNVGYSALDTAGVTAIDDAVAGQLGRLAPRLAKVGGPLVQAALAVPMIYSASETGDPKAIGAASFGAIGGIGAGMAGQALIPVPGVGFVIGVVVGEGAAHVGGLAADAMYNEDPAKREAAVKELKQIQRDYIPNPLDPLRAPGATINLAGAAVSSVGRAVNTIGEVASWGGEQLDGLADSTQQTVSQGLGRYLPAGAANVIGTVAVAPLRANSVALQAAGTVVSAVGTGVDMVGQGAEAVGHMANRTADETKRVAVAAATETVRVAGRAKEEFSRTYAREYDKDPTIRGAAKATVAATLDVADKGVKYAERKAHEALDTGRELVSSAGSWLADRTPSWLGGNVGRDRDDDKPVARKAPASAPAAAAKPPSISQQTLDELEKAGWTKKLDLNGDGQIAVNEVNAAFKKYGITAGRVDDNKNGKLDSQEISEDLNVAIRARKASGAARG